ncbi:hypothetical protein N9062_00360, partial [Akkermansiaceae bacterium]|jgi:hypothetical protein|nr:hypothetical protein [Akkermansiaceae bacterium]MDB4509429.1 hypothetical protein [Akkermansiaceae bacterium]
MNDLSINGLLTRNRTGKVWPILYFLTLIAFAGVVFKLTSAFEARSRFILMGPNAYYVVKEVDFAGAKEMHLEQADLATTSLLNRGPSGFDSERRLKYLFNAPSYQKAVQLASDEAAAFEAKSLHQKAEVFETKIQKMSSRSVQVLVVGQLIRTGVFEGESFTEVLRFELRMTFADNPALVDNGRFPTVVENFELQTEAL